MLPASSIFTLAGNLWALNALVAAGEVTKNYEWFVVAAMLIAAGVFRRIASRLRRKS